MSAIDEKLIRDKWVDIVHSQAKGRIVDSTSLAVEIVRWSEARQAERIASLEQAARDARQQLRATQENWREDCLFKADDILTKALGEKAEQY